MRTLAWAWVRGTDGVKLAGDGPIGPGPFLVSAGIYQLPVGAAFAVAEASHMTTGTVGTVIPEIPNAYSSGTGDAPEVTVETINRVGSLSSLDFLVVLLAE